MGGVVPEQVVGPTARLTEGVGVGAAKEVGLDIHLLDGEVTRGDPLVDPLVRGIKAPGMTDHAHQVGARGRPGHGLRVGPTVGEGDLDLDVLARLEGRNGLFSVELRRGAEDHRVDVR